MSEFYYALYTCIPRIIKLLASLMLLRGSMLHPNPVIAENGFVYYSVQ